MSGQNTIIIGGGLTGLTMAAALGFYDIPVTLIAPAPKKVSKTDKRSTAIMMDGIAFLTKIGVWQSCADQCAPLETMRIINGTQIVDFNADEMDKTAFALNILNDVLLKALRESIKKSKNITVIDGLVDDLSYDDFGVTVTLNNDQTTRGSLIIGADGYQSKTRQINGIDVQSHDFKQKAFVCCLSHTSPHNNTSTEIHRAGGPFTLVPLPSYAPNHQSALVWCDTTDMIDNAMAMTKNDQTALIQKIIGTDMLGTIDIISTPQSWPIHALKTSHVTAPRTALIGEAAHALAPIAAQGFNLSLRDIQTLTTRLTNAHDLGLDLGSSVTLNAYAKNRQTDIALRYHSVGFLNTLIANTSLPASALKRAGLLTMEWVSPLRHFAMRFGMKG